MLLVKLIIRFQKQIYDEWCYAIAFNKGSTLMGSACSETIKIYSFMQGQLELIQVLKEHTGLIFTLCFMKKSDELISGSFDKSIRIWGMENKQWYCKHWINDCHNNCISCVKINHLDDLMISCSYDHTIKFWEKRTKWVSVQILKIHTDVVWSICLNDSQNQLVSCGEDQQIVICKLCQDRQWRKSQIIKMSGKGIRICFIQNNIVTIQQRNDAKMDVFELNETTKIFNKKQDLKLEEEKDISCYFPQVFNNRKQILVNKNGQTVYLIRKQNSNYFVVDQVIKFQNDYIFGTITDDGEYLVTFDYESENYQVRKYSAFVSL